MKAELKRAADLVAFQRREALARKRLSGDPRNPFRPRYGAELTFTAAAQKVDGRDVVIEKRAESAPWYVGVDLNHYTGRRTAVKSNGKLCPLGKLVVKALTDQDKTKTQLAAEIGTSPQYLSYILYGVRSGEKYLPAIIAALNLDPRKVEKVTAA